MKRTLTSIAAIMLIAVVLPVAAQTRDIDKPILTQRQQAELYNKNLEWKLDNVLPEVMRRENFDMWIIICFEYDEDPVYRTLTTWPIDGARRLSAIVFHDSPEGFKKLTATWHGAGATGYMYQSIFTDRSGGPEGQFTAIADYVRQADPKRIGINYDPSVIDDFSHANGLSHFHYEKLYAALDPVHRGRLVSAKPVVMGWFETRTPWEVSFYRHLAGLAKDLIEEMFSSAVITPDVTTTDDVRWWAAERITNLNLGYWFFPSFSIKRSPEGRAKYGNDNVIRRGDLLHSDVGIFYMGLTTDMQNNGYVLKHGETEAPAGINALFAKGVRFQDICMEEYVEGRTGNEMLRRVLERGRAEGLNPTMYTHPVNYYGHGSGISIGRTDEQNHIVGAGEHKLYNNTTYALEFSVAANVPEWGNERVSMGFEETIIFDNGKARFTAGRPTKIFLVK